MSLTSRGRAEKPAHYRLRKLGSRSDETKHLARAQIQDGMSQNRSVEGSDLLHGYRFCKIPWLVNIRALMNSGVVSKELDRN